MTTVSRVKLVTVLLFMFVLGAVAIALGCHRLSEVAQIQGGPVIEGRATGWDTRPKRNRTTYLLRYSFDADGATHTGGPVAVSKDVYEDTRKNPALAVRHAPGRVDRHLPEVAIANARESAVFTALPGVIICAFVALGSALAWFGARLKAKAARAATPPADNFPKDPPAGSA